MTAAQNARAEEAFRFVKWLRASSREMVAEGNPWGGYKAARLALLVAELFGAEAEAVATVVPPIGELDEIEVKPARRATYAGPVPDEEE